MIRQTVNFRTLKFALLLGAINGFIFYLAYQPAKAAYVQYLWFIKNDDYVYVVLPQIYRIASDVGEIFVWTVLFTLASYTVHRLWAGKLKSTVAMWAGVALVSVGVPAVSLWVLQFLIVLLILILDQIGACFFPLNCGMPPEEMASLLVRESVDVKFEILLCILALAVNLVYGAILAKLSKHFAER